MYALVCRNGNCCFFLLDSQCSWPSPNSYWQELADLSDAVVTSVPFLPTLYPGWEGQLSTVIVQNPFVQKISSPLPFSHTLKHVKNALYFGGRCFICINLSNSIVDFLYKYNCHYSTPKKINFREIQYLTQATLTIKGRDRIWIGISDFNTQIYPIISCLSSTPTFKQDSPVVQSRNCGVKLLSFKTISQFMAHLTSQCFTSWSIKWI